MSHFIFIRHVSVFMFYNLCLVCMYMCAVLEPQLKHLILLEAEDWFNLGLQLDLSYAKLSEIRRNYPRDDSSCRREMFQLWLRIFPSASYQQLTVAYQSLGKTEMVELRHGESCNLRFTLVNLQILLARLCLFVSVNL